jgi:hypothetical protein
MATSSFFHNVVIDTEEKFKDLVVALEKSERSQPDHEKAVPVKAIDVDTDWIRKTLGQSESKR